jgi:hypothetical protein
MPLFYIQEGKVKLTIVSQIGKEAILLILNKGGFFGEGCLTGQALRIYYAMTDCSVITIDKKSMNEVLRRGQFCPICLWDDCSHGTSATKRIWLTSFSIPVNKDWPG